jgi:hypothetical protein
MHILGANIGTTDTWGMFQAEIISTFLPPRIKEQFLVSHILDRFQSPMEDLTEYIMSVLAAAKILGFLGTEVQLVHRIVQNMRPKFKSHCIFSNRPESIADLLSLATMVAEAVAVEDQRRLKAGSFPRGVFPGRLSTPQFKARVHRPRPSLRIHAWRVEKQAIFNVHALLKRFRLHRADVREKPEVLGNKGFIPGAQRVTASGILVPLRLGFIDPKRKIEYWSILVDRKSVG